MEATFRLIPSKRRPVRGLLLVAEDDYDTRGLLSSLLSDDGYDIVEAADGVELLEYLTASAHQPAEFPQPDVVVADIHMPGYSGLHALATMRSAGRTTPFILITGFYDESVKRASWKLGAVTLLRKPVDLDDLRMIILNAASRSGSAPGSQPARA